MGFLDRLKFRWQIMKRLAEDANIIEQSMPHAAYVGMGFNTHWWAAAEFQLDQIVFWHAYTRLGCVDKGDFQNA